MSFRAIPQFTPAYSERNWSETSNWHPYQIIVHTFEAVHNFAFPSRLRLAHLFFNRTESFFFAAALMGFRLRFIGILGRAMADFGGRPRRLAVGEAVEPC